MTRPYDSVNCTQTAENLIEFWVFSEASLGAALTTSTAANASALAKLQLWEQRAC